MKIFAVGKDSRAKVYSPLVFGGECALSALCKASKVAAPTIEVRNEKNRELERRLELAEGNTNKRKVEVFRLILQFAVCLAGCVWAFPESGGR